MGMKPHVKAIGFVLFLCMFLPPAVGAAERAPEWELNDLDGQPRRLEEWRGEWVLLKLGATWCRDCAQQLVELGKVRDELDAMGVEVLDIFLREDRYTVNKYWRKKSTDVYKPTILYDYRGKLVRDYAVMAIPQLILVDREGMIAWRGPYTPGPELVEVLKRHIVADPGAGQP